MKAEAIDETIGAWEQRCKAHGLTLTVSRQAILRALAEQDAACDAVRLLKAAQIHHASVSIGSVYRFLRELEQHGFVHAYSQTHGRTRWRLHAVAPHATSSAANDIRCMIDQLRDFLRALEQLGLAENIGVDDAALLEPARRNDVSSNDPMLAVLCDLAGHLGYRLRLQPNPRFTPSPLTRFAHEQA